MPSRLHRRAVLFLLLALSARAQAQSLQPRPPDPITLDFAGAAPGMKLEDLSLFDPASAFTPGSPDGRRVKS